MGEFGVKSYMFPDRFCEGNPNFASSSRTFSRLKHYSIKMRVQLKQTRNNITAVERTSARGIPLNSALKNDPESYLHVPIASGFNRTINNSTQSNVK